MYVFAPRISVIVNGRDGCKGLQEISINNKPGTRIIYGPTSTTNNAEKIQDASTEAINLFNLRSNLLPLYEMVLCIDYSVRSHLLPSSFQTS